MLSKSDFLLLPEIHFLNHGSFGAAPRVLVDECLRWQERMERQPVLMHRDLPELMRDARIALAAFLGCDPRDMVYVSNSTFGVNVAAHAIGRILQEGDEILTTDHEYGACMRAWQQHVVDRGVRIVAAQVPMPVPAYAELADLIWAKVTDRTRVLFLSHITSPTAVRMPVEALIRRANERGILTVIDGSHIPGHVELHLDTLGADVYTGNCHKWMCTPKGSAFLHVRREMQGLIGPLVVSWGPDGTPLHESAFVDEHEYLGTRDPAPFLSVPAGIRWMESNDWSEVQRRSRDLVRWGMDRLTEIPGLQAMHQHRDDEGTQMGAVILPSDTNVNDLKSILYDRYAIEVVVHRWKNVPILRFSTHAHTSHEDVAALVDAMTRQFVA